MNIDWTTVIAQIVNFIGLVWLLNKFLYDPVIKVISARESALEERFARADTLQAEAAREIAAYEGKRTELEQTRDEYLREAREEAGRALANMLADADEEARAARRRLSEQLEMERRELEQAVQTGLVTHVSEASARVLAELAGRSVADGVIDAFEKRLRARANGADGDETGAPDGPDRSGDVLNLRRMNPPITLRLSFDPDGEQRERLRWVLHDVAGRRFADEDIRFVHDPSLVLGIELHYDGSMVSWHARHVIGTWEAEALRRLARATGGDTQQDAEKDPGADAGGGVEDGRRSNDA